MGRRAVVIHPDLGIGGAERLIVDASKALQEGGNDVTIYTGYHNRDRCFEETRNGTLKTIVIGQWLPRTLWGKCHALMAYIRMIYIAIYIMLFSKHDLVLCDQVSACIPFLKLDLRNKPRIVFYCHFPDLLLTKRDSFLKLLYRKPLDAFEEWSTSLADLILVNSKFTRNVVKRTFTSLRDSNLIVLHPCVDIDYFIENKPSKEDCDNLYQQYSKLSRNSFTFLSLNRFERKKCLQIALEALSGCLLKLKEKTKPTSDKRSKKSGIHLIIAGGYDPRLNDSVAYREELIELTMDLELESHVTFIESPNDDDKLKLLQICDAVVYTPENEHFGIVPLEAMVMSKPVIARASGGPLETIVNGENGLLCHGSSYESFTEAMLQLYLNQKESTRMGACGFRIVKSHYSYEVFRDSLNIICFNTCS